MSRLDSDLKSELKYAWEELALIYKVCDIMVSLRGIREIANFFLSELIKLLEVKGGLIVLLDEKSQEISIVASSGINRNIGRGPILSGKGVIGEIVKQGSPKIITEEAILKDEPLFKLFPSSIFSLLSVPMRSGKNIMGIIDLWDKIDGSEFTTRELNFVLSLGTYVGVIIENNCLYQDIEQREAELIRTEKLATIGTLLFTVAHQLKNPLNNLSLSMYSLNRLLPNKTPEIEEWSKNIKMEIERSSKIIKNFLDFAKPSGIARKKEEDINLIVEQTLDILKDSALNVKIETRFNPLLPKIIVDPDQMKEVFLNIVLNAQESMVKGGTLTVITDTIPEENLVAVTFSDTGCGISPKSIRNIFEPFYTTKQRGMGLGLSIAQRIIQKHGGTIGVESVVGKGTTFNIRLPIKKEE